MEAITSQLELPETLPVMVLADCTLFQNCLLPLYIFEPRYRYMLEQALESDRMFCVGTTRSGSDGAEDSSIHDISTAGLIRACVRQSDGTSNLILQGVRRIRLAGWEQRTPFRIARVESFVDLDGAHGFDLASKIKDQLAGDGNQVSHDPGQLARELLAIATTSGALSETLTHHLNGLRDPAAIADVIAYNVIGDPQLKQEILEVPRLRTRLRLLLAYCSERSD